MKVAVIGTGAIGGYYGGLLAKAGKDVPFLLNSDFHHVKQHGLTINSVTGNFQLGSINAYQSTSDMPSCDLIIIALKGTQNHLLDKILPPLLHPDSKILFLQNGLDVEHHALAHINKQAIFSGLCFICSNKTQAGTIDHLDFGTITIGQYKPATANTTSAELLSLARFLQSASLQIKTVANLAQARWEKLVWNVPFNGLSVVLNCETLAMMNTADCQQLVRDIMHEVTLIADSYQHPINNHFINDMITSTSQMASYKPSMKIDFDEGRALEFNEIYQQVIDAAKEANIAIPKIEMLAAQLRFCIVSRDLEAKSSIDYC